MDKRTKIMYCNGLSNLHKCVYNLEKLNEIAKSIKKPHFNNVQLVYDENLNLHWFNANNIEWYEVYNKIGKEKESLDIYDFAIKVKYQNIKNTIVLNNVFLKTDEHLAKIVYQNLKQFLENEILINE